MSSLYNQPHIFNRFSDIVGRISVYSKISLFSFQELMSARGSIHEENSNALFLIRCAHEIQDVRVMEFVWTDENGGF